MPYSVNFNSCTFLLNQQTQLILNLFKKAWDLHYKPTDKEDRLSADLAISNSQLRKGFFPKLLNTIENLNEKKYGANFVILNPIENIKLDPKAEKMMYAYTNEINNLFTRNKLKSYDMNKEENINSPALVFRILLIRLITIALCDDNAYVRDGDVLLKIYRSFIDQVLYHINEFPNEKEIFAYFAKKKHLGWMHAIRQVVLAVKLIHSHRDVLTECLTTLKSLSFNIQRMILAHLVIANSQCEWPLFSKIKGAPKITPTDLEDQFIEDKLNEYEEYMAEKNSIKDVPNINEITRAINITTFAAIEHLGPKHKARSILDVADICDNPQIAALIACKNNKCPKQTYQKLETFYSLYFKSRCLLISLEQIDELITTCSWVPLVMGNINLSQICGLIRNHCEECMDLLLVSNSDLINKFALNQVIMQKCFHAQSQLTEIQPRIKALEELQNPVQIKKIKEYITDNISNLIEVQNALDICLLQYNSHKNSELAVKLPLKNKPTANKLISNKTPASTGFFSADYQNSRIPKAELEQCSKAIAPEEEKFLFHLANAKILPGQDDPAEELINNQLDELYNSIDNSEIQHQENLIKFKQALMEKLRANPHDAKIKAEILNHISATKKLMSDFSQSIQKIENSNNEKEKENTLKSFATSVKAYEDKVAQYSLGQKIFISACTFAGGLFGAVIGAALGIGLGAAVGGGIGNVIPVFGTIGGAILSGSVQGIVSALKGLGPGTLIGASAATFLLGISASALTKKESRQFSLMFNHTQKKALNLTLDMSKQIKRIEPVNL